jgi:Ca2+-binding RTX toxin-like protein
MKNPRKVATIPGNGNDWSGEGVHVISHQGRDLLLLSSEPCNSSIDAQTGGMTIVDVTNPRQPVKLVSNFGDFTSGGIDGEDCRVAVTPCVTPHSVHSVMGWVDGNKAFAVMVDNEEFPDVDIADITDPANPVIIAEVGLDEFIEGGLSPQVVNGGSIFLHDMQVRRIDGVWHMMVSYWDVGWVLLNIEDPSNPVFVDDYDYPDPDPLTGFSPPEGNAHQSWWSKDARFVLGTDEDFDPFRLVAEITSGENAGDNFGASNGSGTPPVDDTRPLEGPTRWVGRACNADPAVPAAGSPDEIALVTRGACFFTDKTANVENAGYAAIIVFNSNAAAGGGCSAVVGASVEGGIPFLGVGRDTGFKLLNTAYNEDECQDPSQNDGTRLPPIGTEGESVRVTAEFDGWGYVQMFDGRTLEHIDEYAVKESLDPRFAKNFGDLSVHEVKTDPRGDYLGYISYYNAGARVVEFGAGGVKEVGHFIDGRGNNFWGTFPVRNGKKPPFLLFSDRDFGLYVLKFTGGKETVNRGACKGFAQGSRTSKGNGKVIVGTDGSDTLVGTPGKDIICGLGGKDVISGRGGKDRIVGNGGADIIDGARGNDVIFGNAGNDTLRGNKGRDTLRGNAGNDTLQGGRGDDILRGGVGTDTLKGHDGNDFLNGGVGTDTCSGGRGKDVVRNCEAGPMEGGRRSPGR